MPAFLQAGPLAKLVSLQYIGIDISCLVKSPNDTTVMEMLSGSFVGKSGGFSQLPLNSSFLLCL